MLSANEVRIETFNSTYYIDDIGLVRSVVSQMMVYRNQIYGDWRGSKNDGAIFLSRKERYGTFGVIVNEYVTLGYGMSLGKFDIGLGFAPHGKYWIGSAGIGRTFFARRFDLSSNIKIGRETKSSIYEFILRLKGEKQDYRFIPIYNLKIVDEPKPSPSVNYMAHNVGFALERSLLEDGMVFIIGHWEKMTGDLDAGSIRCIAGVEMKVSNNLGFRFGINESLTDDLKEFRPLEFNPGIRVMLGDFDFDFFINQDWPFKDKQRLLVGAGIDFKFDKF